MSDILKKKTSKILIFLTTVILVIWTYFSKGIYFGWFDDIMILNVMKGQFSQHTYPTDSLFRLISYLLSFLYTKIPLFPWYGVFLTTTLVLSIYLILLYLFESVQFKKTTNWLLLIILLCSVYILFLEEFIVLINFTKASVLLTGISLLFYWQKLNSKPNIIFHPILLLFIVGYLIRDQTANVIILFIILLITLQTLINKSYWNAFKKFFLITSTLLILLNTIFQLTRNNDYGLEKEVWPYISNIVDGNRYQTVDNKDISTKDSVKLAAIRLYYFLDKDKIDIPFLEKMGGDSPFSLKTLQFWKEHLTQQILLFENRYESSYEGLNLFNKFKISVFISTILIIFSFLIYCKKIINKKVLLTVFLSIISLYSYFFLIAIFFKYEDRLFTPVFIIVLVYTIDQLKLFSVRTQSFFLILTIVILLPFTLLRSESLNQIRDLKREDLRNKSEYINELNGFKNKIFIHDYWSQVLIYSSPYKEVELIKNNTHIIFGDMPLYLLESYRLYLQKSICSYGSYVEFYECMAENKNAIFIMPPFRAKLIESYLKILYNKDFIFEEIYPNSVLNIKTSFFTWNEINYRYYQIIKTKRNKKDINKAS